MKAFPRMSHTDCFGYHHPAEDGMDLRDYFAAKAMEALAIETIKQSKGNLKLLAENSYEVADAMMKAREQ